MAKLHTSAAEPGLLIGSRVIQRPCFLHQHAMHQSDIAAYISNAIEESLTLDYKAADALARSDGKKREITKDVSAMANAAGGRIIYGVRESADPAQRHCPDAIDPINDRDFSKEWLEQVISGVRPRIRDLVITAVRISGPANGVVYVVDVPQGETAHQATDLRYYRRYNFESVPMFDHEIRDVMARTRHPQIDIVLEIYSETIDVAGGLGRQARTDDSHWLRVIAVNQGSVYASYINGTLSVPREILHRSSHRYEASRTLGGLDYVDVVFDNVERDIVDWDRNPIAQTPKFGPGRFVPLLPGTSRALLDLELDGAGIDRVLRSGTAEWTVYADNAVPRRGQVRLSDVTRSDFTEDVI